MCVCGKTCIDFDAIKSAFFFVRLKGHASNDADKYILHGRNAMLTVLKKVGGSYVYERLWLFVKLIERLIAFVNCSLPAVHLI